MGKLLNNTEKYEVVTNDTHDHERKKNFLVLLLFFKINSYRLYVDILTVINY